MRSRLIVAAVFIPLILILFIFLPTLAMPIAFSIVSMIAVYEVLTAAAFIRHRRILLYSILFAGTIPFWAYYGTDGHVGAIGLLIYVIILFIEMLIDSKRLTYEKIQATAFTAFIVPFFLSSLVRLIIMPEGRFYVILPVLIAFVSDAGGLFVGTALGRHKLAPEISPKKSVEGAVGAVLAAVLATLLYGVIVRFGFKLEVNFGLLLIYSIFGSIIAQLGDLSFSLIKRQYNVKDFGRILPGHGGIMDRFDSVFLTGPFIEMMVVFAPVFIRVAESI